MSEFYCPNCRQPMSDAPELAGQQVACPGCGYQFVMRGIPVAAPAVTSVYRDTVKRRFKPATSIFDIFDWKFETYVTPIIIRTTWALFIAGMAIFVALKTYDTFKPAPKPTLAKRSLPRIEPPQRTDRSFGQRPEPAPTFPRVANETRLAEPEPEPEEEPGYVFNTDGEFARKLAAYFFELMVACIALLWVRVCLETAIVIFNIANSLQSLDEKTKPRS